MDVGVVPAMVTTHWLQLVVYQLALPWFFHHWPTLRFFQPQLQVTYNNTVEFNRGTEGTTGNGILIASRQWGLTPTIINSSAALTSTLKEGHHVVAAVQQDKFSPWGYGTSQWNRSKRVLKWKYLCFWPYNSSNNGWYPIASLWNEQSTQSADTVFRNPFVKNNRYLIILVHPNGQVIG